MTKKRTFISFDYDHDDFLREAIVGQAKNTDSPFEIIDYSVRRTLLGDWKPKVKEKISRSDIVIVICGEHTHTADGVAFELETTKKMSKPYFLLKGYRDKKCTKPTSADSTDKIYIWSWTNLNTLIGGCR